ncbi:aldose epimerase family protein [Rhodotorula paludigena]|uniref:aldose epimerase family protein n=1 Tax=Rhodotorula paludigena TaxID=86838 RepID=UPI00316EFA10
MSATDLSAFRDTLGYIPASASDAQLRQALERRINQWSRWNEGGISHLWRRLRLDQRVNFGRGIANFVQDIREGHIHSESNMPTPQAVHSWLELDDAVARAAAKDRNSAEGQPHTSHLLAKPELSRRYAAVSGVDKRRWDARAQHAATLSDLLESAQGRSRHASRAPLRTLATALFLPGALLALSCWALIWSLPPLGDQPHWTDYQKQWTYRNSSNVNVFERFEIRASDGSARASFIPLGATLVDFWVKDRKGEWRDVVLGYDNTTEYLADERYPYFGAVVGRYANRIADASYYDPATNARISLPANEDGQTTLHGGKWGYSRAGWKIVEKKAEKVIFGLPDEGAEGFPGNVYTLTSYELLSHPTRLVTSFTSRVLPSTPPPAANAPSLPSPSDDPSPEEPKTPIMLSSHVYWNLDGYQKDEDGAGGSARDHEMWIDARRSVEVDGELIPTGKLPSIPRDTALDFSAMMEDGRCATLASKLDLDETKGLCGNGCTGIDNALIYDRPDRNHTQESVLRLQSPSSGIRLQVRTNQPLVHLYTTNTFRAGLYARKDSHLPGGKKREDCVEEEKWYGKNSAVAIEQEGWIDALHHQKEWDVDPFYSPARPYQWWSEYEFSTYDV